MPRFAGRSVASFYQKRSTISLRSVGLFSWIKQIFLIESCETGFVPEQGALAARSVLAPAQRFETAKPTAAFQIRAVWIDRVPNSFGVVPFRLPIHQMESIPVPSQSI